MELVYGFIFLAYVLFCLVTINIIVKKGKDSVVSKACIYLVYIYYSLLLSFALSVVGEYKERQIFETIVQMTMCWIICSYYYSRITNE